MRYGSVPAASALRPRQSLASATSPRIAVSSQSNAGNVRPPARCGNDAVICPRVHPEKSRQDRFIPDFSFPVQSAVAKRRKAHRVTA